MGGKLAEIDHSGIWWCAACGQDLPVERMHLNTCSSKCAAWLNADDRRRVREARKAQREMEKAE